MSFPPGNLVSQGRRDKQFQQARLLARAGLEPEPSFFASPSTTEPPHHGTKVLVHAKKKRTEFHFSLNFITQRAVLGPIRFTRTPLRTPLACFYWQQGLYYPLLETLANNRLASRVSGFGCCLSTHNDTILDDLIIQLHQRRNQQFT